MTIERRDILAYLIGAGVAGTALVFPYAGRAVLAALAPQLVVATVPFFLLPLLWGLWNVVYVRAARSVGIGGWGAGLGALAGGAVNLLLWSQGQWFPAAGLLLVFLPPVYFLAWLVVVGPLNEALGVR